MRFQTKLMAAFGSIAVITLGVSLLGLWQANRLGSALYEIGVVRLPSIVALNELGSAKRDLDAAARVLSNPFVDDETAAAEKRRQTEAWERARRGWAMYEPQPQSAEEAALWKAFVSAWNTWHVERRRQPITPAVAAHSANVDRLLAQLSAVNVQLAAQARENSVAGHRDLARVRLVMLLAALASVTGAIAWGFVIAERLRATEVEREKAAVALTKSEEKSSKLFQSAPVGIALTRLTDSLIMEVNDEFLKLLGYTREEALGRTSVELGIHADQKTRDEVVRPLLPEGAAAREVKLRAKDGEIKTVRAAAHILEMDGEKFIVSAIVDVTDQRRAETELRRSEQKYRTLVEGVRDVIVAMTPDGTLTALNSAFEQVTGMSRADCIGQSFVGLLVDEDVAPALTLFDAVLQGEQPPVTTLRIRTAGGRVRTFEFFLTPHREHGMVVAILGIARDVTDRVQLEEEFRQAQKMEAVGRLAGGVAHDFNNLLTVIGGHCSFLLEDLDESDPKRADVEAIMNASRFASTLTRQLLAFSRRQVLQPQVLNLNEVVRASENLLKRLMGVDVRLETKLGSGIGNVRADAGQLEQTIMNLAVNARDAMPDGGTLTIATANAELSGDRLHEFPGVAAGRYVMLSVSDSGVGMDEHTRDKIFEPFFTTKEAGKGTGLGLATVFGIVKQSKGHIHVMSALGRGSTFEIYFPEVFDAAEKMPPTSARPVQGAETVLVVEDEAPVRAIVRETLERSGYSVLEASSGDAAMSISASHQGPIHLLLTDLVMPGMSGRDVAREMSILRPGIRVLFMSGHTGDNVVAREVLEREAAFVQKPFAPDDLARSVRAVLDAR